MNNKDLEALLIKKKAEFEAAQKEVNRARCSKQLYVFSEMITNNDKLVDLIISQNLTAHDCRLFATKLLNDLPSIYSDHSDEIQKNQARRLKKNQARNERRTAHVQENSHDNTNYPDVNMDRSY